MKTTILCAALFYAAGGDPAHGQGTSGNLVYSATLTGANEVPPNTSAFVANGYFGYSLPFSENAFQYAVYLPFPSFSPLRAGVYAPATSDQNGPLVFDLGQFQVYTSRFCVIAWPDINICSTSVLLRCI